VLPTSWTDRPPINYRGGTRQSEPAGIRRLVLRRSPCFSHRRRRRLHDHKQTLAAQRREQELGLAWSSVISAVLLPNVKPQLSEDASARAVDPRTWYDITNGQGRQRPPKAIARQIKIEQHITPGGPAASHRCRRRRPPMREKQRPHAVPTMPSSVINPRCNPGPDTTAG